MKGKNMTQFRRLHSEDVDVCFSDKRSLFIGRALSCEFFLRYKNHKKNKYFGIFRKFRLLNPIWLPKPIRLPNFTCTWLSRFLHKKTVHTNMPQPGHINWRPGWSWGVVLHGLKGMNKKLVIPL